MSFLQKIPFVKNSIQSIVNREVNNAIDKHDKEEKAHRLSIKQNIADFYVGMPIIIIPDDTKPVTVGIIRGVEQADPFVPIVTDYVENKDVVCMTNYISFNEQNLKAVLKLNADERGGVFYNYHVASEEGHVAKDREDAEERTFEQIKEALTANGFYHEAKKYWNGMKTYD